MDESDYRKMVSELERAKGELLRDLELDRAKLRVVEQAILTGARKLAHDNDVYGGKSAESVAGYMLREIEAQASDVVRLRRSVEHVLVPFHDWATTVKGMKPGDRLLIDASSKGLHTHWRKYVEHAMNELFNAFLPELPDDVSIGVKLGRSEQMRMDAAKGQTKEG